MIERVVENWLTKSGERTFQVPFCYMLAHRGHTVVHLTRHCAMELGKDVLAIAPDGIPCAYQLKGGDIKLSDWRTEVGPQVEDLVMGAIVHPSVPSDVAHRPFLVTNGRIEEEVQRAISDRNLKWKDQGYQPLQTITHTEILQWALDLGTDLWPSELRDVAGLIELATLRGTDTFPKHKLAVLLESTLGMDDDTALGEAACSRALASGALVTSLAVAPFAEQENHVAEVEAWTVFASYVLALAERWGLSAKTYTRELDLAKRAAYNALGRLVEEIYQREKEDRRLVEGNSVLDAPFYRARLTWMVGLLSVYTLWRRGRPDGFASDETGFDFDVDRYAIDFGHRYRGELLLWGEAAMPQFLAYYWAWRVTDGTWNPDWFIASVARQTASECSPIGTYGGLPSPYYEIADLAPFWIDHELSAFLPDTLRLKRKPLGETFSGASYYLESLFQLVIRKNFKQTAKAMWPSVSRVSSVEFQPAEGWQSLRWRNWRVGQERNVLHAPTQEWATLRATAQDSDSGVTPAALVEDPAFALLHLIVFPHRVSTSKIRWLDTALRKRCRK